MIQQRGLFSANEIRICKIGPWKRTTRMKSERSGICVEMKVVPKSLSTYRFVSILTENTTISQDCVKFIVNFLQLLRRESLSLKRRRSALENSSIPHTTSIKASILFHNIMGQDVLGSIARLAPRPLDANRSTRDVASIQEVVVAPSGERHVATVPPSQRLPGAPPGLVPPANPPPGPADVVPPSRASGGELGALPHRPPHYLAEQSPLLAAPFARQGGIRGGARGRDVVAARA